jgi:hypothetical protein
MSTWGLGSRSPSPASFPIRRLASESKRITFLSSLGMKCLQKKSRNFRLTLLSHPNQPTLIAGSSENVLSAVAGVGRHGFFLGCRRAPKRTTAGCLVWSDRRTPIGNPPRRIPSSDLAWLSRLHAGARPECCRDRWNECQVGAATGFCQPWMPVRSAKNQPRPHSRAL